MSLVSTLAELSPDDRLIPLGARAVQPSPLPLQTHVDPTAADACEEDAPPRFATERAARPVQRSLSAALRQVFGCDISAQALRQRKPAPPFDTLGPRSVHPPERPREFNELEPLPFANDTDDEGDTITAFPPWSEIDAPREGGAPATSPVATIRISADDRDAGRLVDAQSPPEITCRIVDVSMSGVALLAAEPLPPGKKVGLKITAPGDSAAVETCGTILRCVPSCGGGFQVVIRLDRFLKFPEIHEIGRHLFAAAIV